MLSLSPIGILLFKLNELPATPGNINMHVRSIKVLQQCLEFDVDLPSRQVTRESISLQLSKVLQNHSLSCRVCLGMGCLTVCIYV